MFTFEWDSHDIIYYTFNWLFIHTTAAEAVAMKSIKEPAVYGGCNEMRDVSELLRGWTWQTWLCFEIFNVENRSENKKYMCMVKWAWKLLCSHLISNVRHKREDKKILTTMCNIYFFFRLKSSSLFVIKLLQLECKM